MKLLVGDDGSAVVRNGMPVYVNDDGREIEVDVPRLFSKITDLNNENKNHREKADDLKQKLVIFDDIENLEDYRTKADEAIKKVANYSDKDLVDAGKVDEIKSAMTAAHQSELEKLRKSFEAKESALTATVEANANKIRQLTIGSAFKSSKYFVGDDSVTLLPPDAAEALFGAHFKLEGGDNGESRIVGYYDRDGKEMIYGSSSPGDAAQFDEAIESLVDRYPAKDRILRAGKAGSGGKGSGNGHNSGSSEKNEVEKLQAKYAELQKAGNITEAIAIKNRLHRMNKASS